ncbi:unnamed protein product [Oppiella nova]|uniref:CoA carboxyltransferase C-terminal domain-containing protein n=2 Tax=Oppiella nova TaxID=334625 RepID=A0A7R9QZI8_9ACAR|nr:unnamed protein product [Oppiella nova]CAG2180625.1 unnamed protein product [Oppiella nova]
MKDMYDQVVKFGAYIVDALHEYKQPIVVYIPPFAELRGGAWAVLDATINPRHMKMFADPDGRGGVLEPEGTVEIRFRAKDLVKTMHRCDNGCKDLLKQINETNSADEKKRLERELADREASLMGMYHQVALSFADLHDTPQRMYEKGCICDVVLWHKSRLYFYWHLRRALSENRVVDEIQAIVQNKNELEAKSMIRRWFTEHCGQHNQHLWDDNRAVAEWLSTQLETTSSTVIENIRCIQRDALSRQIQGFYNDFPSATFDSLVQLIHSGMTGQQRTDLLAALVALEAQTPKSPQLTSSSADSNESVDNKSEEVVVKEDEI